ncbi:MAG TPA: 50S ribosomal protein L18 [Actinobacteria bacterium]|nr:50S ribosomal protein L18 [Actinomycetota bacterium]
MRAQKVRAREKRKMRVRRKVVGTAQRPRLAVFRSLNNMYAQMVDDMENKILLTVSTLDKDLKGKLKNTANAEAAKTIGKVFAEKAMKKGVKEVVFDRGGYLYHGRVKALAEGAREGGLKF